MLNHAEWYVKKQVEDMPEIYEAVDAIKEYLLKEDYHSNKAHRLEQWACYEGDLYELVISILTICLQGVQTYQAIVGMLAGKIPMKDKLHRLHTMAEVIAVVGNTGLIRITKQGPGRSILIDTEYALSGIPELNNHEIVFTKPEKITKNFTDNEGSMLLGSGFKYHTGDICLDHINRMNRIPLKLNLNFLREVEEEPKKPADTYKQEQQWKLFVKESRSQYFGVGGREFYLIHKYDTRGRVYASGYYINYQGSSFKKAIVQLAHKEKLNAE